MRYSLDVVIFRCRSRIQGMLLLRSCLGDNISNKAGSPRYRKSKVATESKGGAAGYSQGTCASTLVGTYLCRAHPRCHPWTAPGTASAAMPLHHPHLSSRSIPVLLPSRLSGTPPWRKPQPLANPRPGFCFHERVSPVADCYPHSLPGF